MTRGRSRCWRSPSQISKCLRSCNWSCRSGLPTKDAVLAQRKAWRDRAQTGPSMRSASASEKKRWTMGQHRGVCAPSLTSSDAWPKESCEYRRGFADSRQPASTDDSAAGARELERQSPPIFERQRQRARAGEHDGFREAAESRYDRRPSRTPGRRPPPHVAGRHPTTARGHTRSCAAVRRPHEWRRHRAWTRGGVLAWLLSFPRGFAPRTPLHALSRAASSARSVRVAHSLALVRVFYETACTLSFAAPTTELGDTQP